MFFQATGILEPLSTNTTLVVGAIGVEVLVGEKRLFTPKLTGAVVTGELLLVIILGVTIKLRPGVKLSVAPLLSAGQLRLLLLGRPAMNVDRETSLSDLEWNNMF